MPIQVNFASPDYNKKTIYYNLELILFVKQCKFHLISKWYSSQLTSILDKTVYTLIDTPTPLLKQQSTLYSIEGVSNG
ncbi:hypothetical protein MNBD_GAMMA12-88 [hydrothermal vent metagenome]|uniref:Uncharacterized protein n=1 Tax=hydrothermal vent metagenome TaxID=652676 RepID=A0A3B0XVR8_9ZZZZ